MACAGSRDDLASRTASRLYSSENFLQLAMTHLRPQFWPFRMCPRNRGRTQINGLRMRAGPAILVGILLMLTLLPFYLFNRQRRG